VPLPMTASWMGQAQEGRLKSRFGSTRGRGEWGFSLLRAKVR